MYDNVMTDEVRHDREQQAACQRAARLRARAMIAASEQVWSGEHDSDFANYFDGPELVRFVRQALNGRIDQDTLRMFKATQGEYIKDRAELLILRMAS